MNRLTNQTLLLLEDAGMEVRYPEIRHVTSDGMTHMSYSCMAGRRVNIEGNLHMKFMMLFTLLDFHLDTTYPDMEGKGYVEKYKDLPRQSDYDLILSQLFRIAKVIRNALVHNHSSFCIENDGIKIDYKRPKHHFILNISWNAFNEFQTAIVMYIKGDMGKGNYFLGIMRSIYSKILAGITQFNDEFDDALIHPAAGIKLKTRVREIMLNPVYETNGEEINFPTARRKLQDWEGLDIYIIQKNEEFLIPLEALDENLSITKINLFDNWKREGSFPHIKIP